MPSSIAERLDRLHAVQGTSDPPPTSSRPWGFAIPLLFVAALVVAALGAFLLAQSPHAGQVRSGPVRLSLAQVSAQAGLTPHQLYGATLNYAIYLSAARTKEPEPGVQGVGLMYQTNGKSIDVYEFQDPSPSTPLAIEPARQAPAVTTKFSGVDCLVWFSPDRGQITQFGFKTSDGLVIYVLPHNSLNPDDVTSIVARLKATPQPG